MPYVLGAGKLELQISETMIIEYIGAEKRK